VESSGAEVAAETLGCVLCCGCGCHNCNVVLWTRDGTNFEEVIANFRNRIYLQQQLIVLLRVLVNGLVRMYYFLLSKTNNGLVQEVFYHDFLGMKDLCYLLYS
jgi:hypothetical protein